MNLELVEALENELTDSKLLDLFYNMEMPLLLVLADMEFTGVKIDVPMLKSYAVELNTEVEGIEKEIIEMAGQEFNVASPKQLGEVLFEKMALDSKRKRPNRDNSQLRNKF